jgi:hypothetical protein
VREQRSHQQQVRYGIGAAGQVLQSRREAVRLLERHPGDVADRLWLARCATLIAGRLAPSQHGAGPVGDRAFQGAAGCLVRCCVDRYQAHTRQAVERSRGFREHGIDCEPGGRAPDQAEPAARKGFAQAAIAEHSGIDRAFGPGATDPNERPRDRLGAERLEPAAAARHKRMFLRTPERLDARHADAGPARPARARTIESPLRTRARTCCRSDWGQSFVPD